MILLWLCKMESTSNQKLVANSNIAFGSHVDRMLISIVEPQCNQASPTVCRYAFISLWVVQPIEKAMYYKLLYRLSRTEPIYHRPSYDNFTLLYLNHLRSYVNFKKVCSNAEKLGKTLLNVLSCYRRSKWWSFRNCFEINARPTISHTLLLKRLAAFPITHWMCFFGGIYVTILQIECDYEFLYALTIVAFWCRTE